MRKLTLLLLLYASRAAADVSVADTNPISDATYSSNFDGRSTVISPPWIVTVNMGPAGSQVIATLTPVSSTEVLLGCSGADCEIVTFGTSPTFGMARLSFQPPVARFAIHVDSCGIGAMTMGVKASGGGATADLPLGPCQPGKWIVVDHVGSGRALIDEVILAGAIQQRFDDMYVDFADTLPAGRPDLAVGEFSRSIRDHQQARLELQVSNLSPQDAAPNAELCVMLPTDLRNLTDLSPVSDDMLRLVFHLGDIAAGGSALLSPVVSFTPPPMDCHTRYSLVQVARSGAPESDLKNNVSSGLLTMDEDDIKSKEHCQNGLDDDCDGKADCQDSECWDFCEPVAMYAPDVGNVAWDFWPPLRLPPSPQRQCVVYVRGQGRSAPPYCCERRPNAGEENYIEFQQNCPPRDPNAKESNPPVGPNGIGWIGAGEKIDYILHYENVGASDAHDVEILDYLPPELDESTLEIADGGTYDPATRLLRWVDPEVWPMDPREVHYSAKVRADAPVGTRVKNVATIVFPDAWPPTRIDTNAVEHVIPLPEAPRSAKLGVIECTPGEGRVKLQIANLGLANAYHVNAKVGGASVDLGTIPALTTGEGELEVAGCDGVEWTLDYGTLDEGAQSVTVVTTPLEEESTSGCGCQVAARPSTSAIWSLLLLLLPALLVRRRPRRA